MKTLVSRAISSRASRVPSPRGGLEPPSPAPGSTAGLATLADVLWPLWDEENRALHDLIVDTRVIRD